MEKETRKNSLIYLARKGHIDIYLWSQYLNFDDNFDMKLLILLVNFQCRNVVWLPGSLSEAAVTNQVCPTCTPGGRLVSHLLISCHQSDLCFYG